MENFTEHKLYYNKTIFQRKEKYESCLQMTRRITPDQSNTHIFHSVDICLKAFFDIPPQLSSIYPNINDTHLL